MSTNNNYSPKTLNTLQDVSSVEQCQQSCDNDNECEGFMYDDETWRCDTKPSRTPNTYKAPNTLYCAADARRLFLFFFSKTI